MAKVDTVKVKGGGHNHPHFNAKVVTELGEVTQLIHVKPQDFIEYLGSKGGFYFVEKSDGGEEVLTFIPWHRVTSITFSEVTGEVSASELQLPDKAEG